MNPNPLRFFLPALAALFAFALPAEAAGSPPTLLASPSVRGLNANGDSKGTAYPFDPQNLGKFFDSNLMNGIVMGPDTHAGDCLLLDYGSTMYYIARVDIFRVNDVAYTLFSSEDGLAWTPVTRLLETEDIDFSGVAATREEWGLWTNAKFLKVVFDDDQASNPGLSEIQVFGYPVQTMGEPELVSAYNRSTWHNADGSQMESNGGGGGYSPSSFFNGNFTDYCLLPRCPDNGYTIIDVTMNGKACYIDKIMIGHAGNRVYSLYYSTDGSTWKGVGNGVNVQYAGIATYPVGALATKVKYVFNQGSAGNWTLKHLAEIQVWGIDPDTIPCDHPNLASVPWTVVPDSATCTERGEVERFCPICEHRFSAMGDLTTAPPLGHDFVTHLDRPGKYKQFGSGSLECSRCGYSISFPEPIDLVTAKVDGVKIGGVITPGHIQFTDISVTSENHPEWGGGIGSMLDNDWTWVRAHLGVWASYGGMENQYADFVFGAEIDLTDVDISVRNVDHVLQFFSVDDATGTETLIGEYPVVRDETLTRARDEKDEEGEGDVICEWQRQSIHFYETPVRHLRIRRTDEATPFGLWGSSPCFIIVECHPWGTVRGASDLRYRTETIMMLR